MIGGPPGAAARSPAETQAIDKKLMLETGRRLAENYLKAPPLMAGR